METLHLTLRELHFYPDICMLRSVELGHPLGSPFYPAVGMKFPRVTRRRCFVLFVNRYNLRTIYFVSENPWRNVFRLDSGKISLISLQMA